MKLDVLCGWGTTVQLAPEEKKHSWVALRGVRNSTRLTLMLRGFKIQGVYVKS